jgi:hypothetical protein
MLWKKKIKVENFGKEMPIFSPISVFKKKELLNEYLNEFQPFMVLQSMLQKNI